jgi:L-2-amino-thiazoline-4-carboxylic acid hydrolase
LADIVDSYLKQKPELLKDFTQEAKFWKLILVNDYGDGLAETIINESQQEFESLIPAIPYIGGVDYLVESYFGSIRCLAFYLAMKKNSINATITGRILYEAILTQSDESQPSNHPSELLTTDQLTERRKRRARLSQERQYPGGYVFEYIQGDGVEFDYGYNFTECAAQKLYHIYAAEEFLPYYCQLDFAYATLYQPGFSRTLTLAKGEPVCNHRFKSR